MKIQIDYDKKTITLENGVNMGEFFDKIEVLVPEWKEWKLETNTIINNWTNPVVYDWWNKPVNPYNPFISQPYYTTASETTCGLVNIDC